MNIGWARHAHFAVLFFSHHPFGLAVLQVLPRLDPQGVDLLRRMLAYDPLQRITAKRALQHPFFADLREAEMREAGSMERAVERGRAQQSLPSPEGKTIPQGALLHLHRTALKTSCSRTTMYGRSLSSNKWWLWRIALAA